VNDLERMKYFYSNKETDEWSLLNCYPLFIDFKQTFIMTKILKNVKLETAKFLDIGAGEGNFILKMFSLGIKTENTVAVEYLETRYKKLLEKIPNIHIINDDFLNVKLSRKYDIITLIAVLTSITDNDIRYNIIEKSLKQLSEGSKLIIYDYFDEDELYLSEDYRALSLNKIKKIATNYKVEIYKKVYLKSRYAKGLCKLHLQCFIPLFECIKIFNDNYNFVVITDER
jgi:phospholipid N-methyltransferase